jgi:hypothetical protein
VCVCGVSWSFVLFVCWGPLMSRKDDDGVSEVDAGWVCCMANVWVSILVENPGDGNVHPSTSPKGRDSGKVSCNNTIVNNKSDLHRC